jgi:hypothetical protein
MDSRLGGPQSRSGRHEEEKILDPTGTRTPTPGRPASSQSVYQLRYPGRGVIMNYPFYSKRMFFMVLDVCVETSIL